MFPNQQDYAKGNRSITEIYLEPKVYLTYQDREAVNNVEKTVGPTRLLD